MPPKELSDPSWTPNSACRTRTSRALAGVDVVRTRHVASRATTAAATVASAAGRRVLDGRVTGMEWLQVGRGWAYKPVPSRRIGQVSGATSPARDGSPRGA